MATFVLVHGAWGGSAGYNAVAKLLRAKAHDVYSPSNTGMGDRSHLLNPSIDLSLHIRDITTVFDYERLSDVILVGHSYGGMVITGVSAQRADRIRSLVYLDAFLPDDGQSLFDLQPADGRENTIKMQRDTPGLVPPRMMPEPVNETGPPMIRGPHPLLTLTEPVKLDGSEKQIKHRTYVLANKLSPAPFQRFYDKVKALNDPSWKLMTMPTGHGIQREDPQGTAALLLAELER
jgi:pimeloyl-ACP methyl ester carboxylesterase